MILFDSVESTIVWKIKREVWVMWNMNQSYRWGTNETAKEILIAACRNSQFEGFVKTLDNIGGLVAILNQEEVEVIMNHTEFSKGALPNSFVLHGSGPDRGGGITAWVM